MPPGRLPRTGRTRVNRSCVVPSVPELPTGRYNAAAPWPLPVPFPVSCGAFPAARSPLRVPRCAFPAARSLLRVPRGHDDLRPEVAEPQSRPGAPPTRRTCPSQAAPVPPCGHDDLAGLGHHDHCVRREGSVAFALGHNDLRRGGTEPKPVVPGRVTGTRGGSYRNRGNGRTGEGSTAGQGGQTKGRQPLGMPAFRRTPRSGSG